jgi:AraC-like DNA-binding protein
VVANTVSGTEDLTVNGGLVANGLRIMAGFGLDAGRIAARAGIVPAEIADPDARVSIERYHAFWAAVVEEPGGQDVGLAYLDAVRLPMLGTLGYVMASAPTVSAAFQAWLRYCRLYGNPITPLIDLDEDRFSFHRRFSPEFAANRPFGESSIAGFVGLCRQLIGSTPVPIEIRYQFARPEDPERATRLLGCAAAYGCDETVLAFPASLALQPVQSCDLSLFTVLSRYADQLLGQSRSDATIADQVRGAIRRTIAQGEPGTSELARELKLTKRTLQRRLADEGVTLSGLVDQIRHELAQTYLRDPRLSITEVAFMLGYSETSAFHRAFRRWTGRSPGELRKSPASSPASPSSF